MKLKVTYLDYYSSQTPVKCLLYGQLSKNFVEFQNTAYLATCLHPSLKIDPLLNLPYVSSISKLVSKGGSST